MCLNNNAYTLSFNVNINTKSHPRNVQIDQSIYNILSNSSIYIKNTTNNLIELSDEFFYDKTKVEDEYRYYIEIQKGTIVKKEQYDKSKDDEGIKKIVILLESPHRSEYRSREIYDRLMPIGPAQGASKLDAGGAISNYLNDVIVYINNNNNNNNIKDGKYIIIISNPIQFQTSLAFIHKQPLQGNIKDLRDSVWKAIWDIKDIRNDFIDRIKKYKPCLIINSCTKNLKQYVTNELNNSLYNPSYNIIPISHPSYNWAKKSF